MQAQQVGSCFRACNSVARYFLSWSVQLLLNYGKIKFYVGIKARLVSRFVDLVLLSMKMQFFYLGETQQEKIM